VQNAQEISESDTPVSGWPARLASPSLAGQLCARPAEAVDEDFLLTLFAESRPELGLLPEPVRDQLIRLQFEAQLRQYRADAPDATDWILELHGSGTGGSEPEPVGRCYLRQGATEIRLLDLAVRTRMHGHGAGSSVLGQLCAVAERAGVPLRLSVWQANEAAIRLYRRLGFVEDGAEGGYLRMHWTAARQRSRQGSG
jgi:ribosomal protein S18 acetylase RimI-like enzyme